MQEAGERVDAMRAQIRRFMQEECAERHDERRREHLALDLACVQRYNDELCDSRDRCHAIRATRTRLDPLLPQASGVALALPDTHLPVLPTFISTYIATLANDSLSLDNELPGAPVPADVSTAIAYAPALVTLTTASAAHPPWPLRVRRARLRNEKDAGGAFARRLGGEPNGVTTDASLTAGPREGYKAPCASCVTKGDVHQQHQQQEEQEHEPDQEDWDSREEQRAATEAEPATAVDGDGEPNGEQAPLEAVDDHLSAVLSEEQTSNGGATFVTEHRSVSDASF